MLVSPARAYCTLLTMKSSTSPIETVSSSRTVSTFDRSSASISGMAPASSASLASCMLGRAVVTPGRCSTTFRVYSANSFTCAQFTHASANTASLTSCHTACRNSSVIIVSPCANTALPDTPPPSFDHDPGRLSLFALFVMSTASLMSAAQSFLAFALLASAAKGTQYAFVPISSWIRSCADFPCQFSVTPNGSLLPS